MARMARCGAGSSCSAQPVELRLAVGQEDLRLALDNGGAAQSNSAPGSSDGWKGTASRSPVWGSSSDTRPVRSARSTPSPKATGGQASLLAVGTRSGANLGGGVLRIDQCRSDRCPCRC